MWSNPVVSWLALHWPQLVRVLVGAMVGALSPDSLSTWVSRLSTLLSATTPSALGTQTPSLPPSPPPPAQPLPPEEWR